MTTNLSNLDQYFGINFDSSYKYDGHSIPRVTAIINKCMDQEGLMNWANKIGLNGIIYKDFSKKTLETGSAAHKAIEEYIKTGVISPDAPKNPIHAFESWWRDLHTVHKTVKVLGQEFTLTTPYFGGTYDMLLQLDDKNCLIDFKTSKSIYYNYFIQLSAYKYMLENEGIQVDKIMVVRIPKDAPHYETFFFDMENPVHRDFTNECLIDFFNMVQVYWSDTLVEQHYKNIVKSTPKGFFNNRGDSIVC